MLVNPEHIDYVLRSHADNFMKDKLTRWLIPLVGEGLLTSEGEFWRRQRRLTQPTFQRQQIERYAAVMVEHTERMLESWHDGQVRDPHEDMAHLTLAIVAKTLFGTELAGEADVVGESLEIVINHFMSPMRWFRFSTICRCRRLGDTGGRSGRSTRSSMASSSGTAQSGHDTGDLLSRLLAARDDQGTGGMTDRQLRDEVVTLVLAGHETTALVLFYTFYLLAQSPAMRRSPRRRAARRARRPARRRPPTFPICAIPSGSFANRCGFIRPPGASPARLWPTARSAAITSPREHSSSWSSGWSTATRAGSTIPRHSSPSAGIMT